jgi:lysozyme
LAREKIVNKYQNKLMAKILATLSGAGIVAAAGIGIVEFEGTALEPRLDPVGNWEVCDGVRVSAAEALEHPKWTPEACSALLKSKTAEILLFVEAHLTRQVAPEVKAALVMFVWNVGQTAFANSTALKKINAGDVAGGCAELKRWVYATQVNGQKIKLPGLVTRREFEENLCFRGAEKE